MSDSSNLPLPSVLSHIVRARVVGNVVYLEYPDLDKCCYWDEVTRERAEKEHPAPSLSEKIQEVSSLSEWVADKINLALGYASSGG